MGTQATEGKSKQNGLAGLRVLAFESRRGAEMAKLIASYGGNPIVTPSMREIPLESNSDVLAFASELAGGRVDMVIFLTGMGTRALARVIETAYPLAELRKALNKVTVVARGPKPLAALKEIGVDASVVVPEPNTWKDLLRVLDERTESFPLRGKRVAVQEYGEPNQELLDGLAARGAQVTRVPVYRWELPQDTGPLRTAVEMAVRGEIDVALFTTSVQVSHLLRIAAEMKLERELRAAFERIAVGSIGPVTSEELRERGLAVDFEPQHPKMGFLVNEAARRAAGVMAAKRSQRGV